MGQGYPTASGLLICSTTSERQHQEQLTSLTPHSMLEQSASRSRWGHHLPPCHEVPPCQGRASNPHHLLWDMVKKYNQCHHITGSSSLVQSQTAMSQKRTSLQADLPPPNSSSQIFHEPCSSQVPQGMQCCGRMSFSYPGTFHKTVSGTAHREPSPHTGDDWDHKFPREKLQ